MINTLANLHAVRWAGATAKEHGLDKPQFTISFLHGPDKKDSATLKLGAKTSDGTWDARVDNRQGTFMISNPDYDALTLPLVQKATPSPAATPSPSTTP
jgi:hypothetical protein